MASSGVEFVELSEQALIGSVLLNTAIWPEVKAKVKPGSFRSPTHAEIFQGLVDLDNTRPVTTAPTVDMLLLAMTMHKHKTLNPKNKIKLFDIADNAATSAAWEYHLGVVVEDAVKREISALTDMARQGVDAQEVAAQVKEKIEQLQGDLLYVDTLEMRESVVQAFKEIEKLSTLDGALTGIPSGLSDLDRRTSGWQPGDLIIVAGRPGMGKSILAKDFAVAAGVPVTLFSLEMEPGQITKRQLATNAKIPFTQVMAGKMNDSAWGRLVEAAEQLGKLPIVYHDAAKITVSEIQAALTRDVARYGTRLAIIDYLQLISPEQRSKNGSREQEVSKISRGLKLIARDLHIPLIAVAQLNRSCEQRGKNKRPILSDLRESGSIEQDADVVMFVYRDAFYHPNSDEHIAELKIAKGRNIRTGTIKAYFSGEFQFFADLGEDETTKRGEL